MTPRRAAMNDDFIGDTARQIGRLSTGEQASQQQRRK
jgi:hypothetical protein